SCFCSSLPRPRDLHSFPTRRSSDLRFPDLLDGQERLRCDLCGHAAILCCGQFRRERCNPRRSTHPVVAVTQDAVVRGLCPDGALDRKSTRLNSSHVKISYAVFCLKK